MAVTMTVPAGAQQSTAIENHAALKSQVRIYELVVQNAVRRGGEQLAQKAREIQPRVGLQMMGLPLVTGVYLPDQGYHFDVQVPDIQPTSLSLFVYLQRQPAPPAPIGPVRPIATGPGVGATGGVVADDPMKPPTKGDPTTDPESFDPQRVYGDFVRNMLVAAIVENSGGLPVRAGERLTIRARVPQMSVNPLSLSDDRELLLSVLADDLLAFRQGTIDRAEIQRRIREYRY